MVLLFPVSSSGKPSLCFLSRLIYADGSLVIPVVCYSLQRFAGSNSRNKQFQSESRSVEGKSVGLWFSSAHFVSIRRAACYYSKVQAPAYIHNRRNAHKINKEVEKTFALADNSYVTVSYNLLFELFQYMFCFVFWVCLFVFFFTKLSNKGTKI